jgi:large subunit ribosomal protein L9
LFGSITAKDIADQIAQTTGIELDKRKLELDDSLKNLGEYPIKIHLYKGVNVTVLVQLTGAD